MAVSRVVLVLTVLAACQFDERGLPRPAGGIDGGETIDSGQSVDTPAPVDAPGLPDAYRPDAAAACVDEDGDSYFVVAIPDADCDEPLDCDDTDPRAHPGQQDYYDVPRTSGGFDFDCDGVETPLDGTLGHECEWDWFWCSGTGWLEQVPACGVEGTYHWCDPDWERCEESSITTARMPCR